MSDRLNNMNLDDHLTSITGSIRGDVTHTLDSLQNASSALEQAVSIPDFGNTIN